MRVSHVVICISIGIWIAYTYPDFAAQAFVYIQAVFSYIKAVFVSILGDLN